MKSIEIEITGEKVQEVGSRSFLINALNFGIKETLKRFIDFVRSKFPKYACFMRSGIRVSKER